jgi:hypothetical protein
MLGGYVTEFFAGLGVSDASSIWGSDGVFFFFFSSASSSFYSTSFKYKQDHPTWWRPYFGFTGFGLRDGSRHLFVRLGFMVDHKPL